MMPALVKTSRVSFFKLFFIFVVFSFVLALTSAVNNSYAVGYLSEETQIPNGFIGGGSAVGWEGDTDLWQYDLPFTFNFYGVGYNTIYISDDGVVGFSDSSSNIHCYSYSGVAIDDFNGYPKIYVFGRDGRFSSSDTVYITENVDNVVVRWQAQDLYYSEKIFNYEIVIYSNSDVQFNYGDNPVDWQNEVGYVIVGITDGSSHYIESAYSYHPTDFFDDAPSLYWSDSGIDYTIDSIEDLNNVRYDLAGDYVLTADLDFDVCGSYEDCDNRDTYTTGEGWDPIGIWGSGSWFTGTFDGNNHTISNIFISTTATTDEIGLFGYSYTSSSIFDVGLLSASISAGSSSNVGVLVGFNEGTVSNSYSTGSVTGELDVGGLVGDSSGGLITDSYSTASVAATSGDPDFGVGGLVGYGWGVTITNSYSTGSVSGYINVGGLIGYSGGTITNSYSVGIVSGDDTIGGLVGWNDGSITNSYSTGPVTGDNFGGGLVGASSGTISDSYSTGSVTVVDAYGGLVGWNDGGTVTDSFWDTETSGMETSDGGTGKTTLEMKATSTFNNTEIEGLDTPWDIIEIENFDVDDPTTWYIDGGIDYPRLFWEYPGYTPPEDGDLPEVLGARVFHPDTRCHWDKPSSPTWMKLEPMTKDGLSGMNLSWTQYDADKITIKIDDGTGKYPWKITKSLNDGHEFLANVQPWQNVMIQPINHCKTGEYSLPVSQSAYPYGWYSVTPSTNLASSKASTTSVLGTSTTSGSEPTGENAMVPDTGSNDILYITTSLSIIGFAFYYITTGKSRRFALRDFEKRISKDL